MPGRTQHFYFKGAYWSLLRREFDALVGYIGRHGYVPDLEMFHAQRLSEVTGQVQLRRQVCLVVRGDGENFVFR